MNKQATIEKIQALAKRRGFFYPSSEIYGGQANTWDWGPYGTELKNNIRDLWWKRFVKEREDIVGLDSSIILNAKVWESSGHTASFTDALVDCKNCKNRTRADHLIEDNAEKVEDYLKNTKEGRDVQNEILDRLTVKRDIKGRSFTPILGGAGELKAEGLDTESQAKIIRGAKLKCPVCGKSDWTDARKFNLLFETHIGIVPENKSLAYLRGEIAQGIFINFKNILDSMRVRVPFGIAQYGKAFRNEITKGQLTHRTLEFDLMEFEYFIREEQWEEKYKYWENEMWQFAMDLGLNKENLRWREHEDFERSFYSKMTKDIEYEYPFGFKEMFGLAYRTNYDLKNHMEKSGKDMQYLDPVTQEKFIPHVIEPTFGLSRLTGVILFDAYNEETVNDKTRTVLKLNPIIAPVKVAIFPLQKDEKLRVLAKDIFNDLKSHLTCEFDDAGNIGKMYRRQDEIGTPWCVTVDYKSIEDKTVTIRDRDSLKQERVEIDELREWFLQKLAK